MSLSKNLIKALSELDPPYVFAAEEDANYFRNALSKPVVKAPVPQILPPKPIPVAAPPPPPPPAPAPEPLLPAQRPKPPIQRDFSTTRHALLSACPELKILEEIPADATAIKIAERWKTKNQSAPISILIDQEPPEQKALLEEIALALNHTFAPAKIVHAEQIEKKKEWDTFLSVESLKLVLICDYTLWQLSSLLPFYKEIAGSQMRTLGKTPLFLLPDLSLYFKDPLLKRSLWKALVQRCQSL